MKKMIFTIACALMYSSIEAQRYEFGRVSDDEIKQTVHPIDSEAQAAILYKKGRVSLQYRNGWQYVYDFEARIKIYNQQGYDYATVIVPLYRAGGGGNESFTNFRGFTHNIEDGRSVRERVRNRDIFDEDVNEFWDQKKITFPNVKEGSVIEYSYKITSPYINSLPEFEFQDQIPVDYAEYTIEIPEYLGYKVYSKGFFPIHRESRLEQGNFSYSYVSSQTARIGTQRTEHNTIRLNKTTTTYTAENVPKMVQEEYMNYYRNYITSIRSELEWIRTPGNALQSFTTTWEDVARSVYRNRNFGGELEFKNYFEGQLQTVLHNVTTPIEGAIAIFEYVKQRMNWNGNYNYFTHNGVRNAFSERAGNVGEINLMLTAMLRHANLDANPVLVSTKRNGIPLFPTQTGFNYVICAVEIDNKLILLDATNKFSTPNVLPEHVLNWYGRLIRKDEHTQEVGLMPETPSRRIVNMEIGLTPNGTIDGRYRVSLTDHYALRYRNSYASISESAYLDGLEKRLGDLEITGYSIQNKTDAYKPLIESYSFSKENAFDIIGGKLYFSPMFFEAITKNPFTAQTRAYPIDFSFANSRVHTINVTLPDGYKIESIPESLIHQLPDDLGEFQFIISNTESTIQLRVSHEIKAALVSAEYYEILKDYFEDMVAKQTEKVILSKI